MPIQDQQKLNRTNKKKRTLSYIRIRLPPPQKKPRGKNLKINFFKK